MWEDDRNCESWRLHKGLTLIAPIYSVRLFILVLLIIIERDGEHVLAWGLLVHEALVHVDTMTETNQRRESGPPRAQEKTIFFCQRNGGVVGAEIFEFNITDLLRVHGLCLHGVLLSVPLDVYFVCVQWQKVNAVTRREKDTKKQYRSHFAPRVSVLLYWLQYGIWISVVFIVRAVCSGEELKTELACSVSCADHPRRFPGSP